MVREKKRPAIKEDREILVFLHYFGGSGESWNWVIEKLSGKYQCIAITLPGFGGSTPLKKPSIENYAQYIQKELQSKEVTRYTLIGHSMGGKIALEIASAAPPDSVQQVILIAPSPPTFEPTPEKEKERMLHHTEPGVAEKLVKSAVKKTLSEEQYFLALKTQLSTDPATWQWWILDGMNHSIAEKLHHLSIPVTILASEDDPVISTELINNQIVPYINNAELISTKGIGHLSPLEDPEWIAEQIVSAIKARNKHSGENPRLSYWHVWTDESGVSHQTKALLTSFVKESMGEDIQPQWNNHLLSSKTKIVFSEQPVGWKGDWHENPKPQWIIPLSGRWYVETMDGHRVEMGPGDISFGGDQNTKTNENKYKGHLSGTIGEEPAKLMIVQLEDSKWKGIKPGGF